ncbi:MAG: pyridoxamine 5'-phosphate oxidase family protein [Saprospiraceae bacterium]|jgi:hypothetical protein|nr:pyridoxamine 5'-phosphate oxidase family protein [Saprospiraceae bacterium]MBK6479957.1 pyridoxamine 5'-phosphate oxidase family protein [Saprospiraceae bacterium]MBK6815184.1 pyridoxamine 5'-phosphate oxidase family protein [Saprospiraceae bacterium]MBK7372222.1 pyridoxamine 5'-phosphate oxidase family protein [Saprospiraceae bacterium]MBK7435314.1 pyridoxamine 5'-phosphate oxidase family protein [Saprospiraceae bacterium]
MLGLLTPHQIEDVLQKELIGRIGCHADLITYVVPVTYVYDEDCIYAHSAEGTKLEMMRKNPSVCFEVDHMHSMVDWQSVIAWGEYEEIINETERSTAMYKLINKFKPLLTSKTALPVHANLAQNNTPAVIFKIKLNKKTGRFESPE